MRGNTKNNGIHAKKRIQENSMEAGIFRVSMRSVITALAIVLILITIQALAVAGLIQAFSKDLSETGKKVLDDYTEASDDALTNLDSSKEI